jgi:hypothetical protein
MLFLLSRRHVRQARRKSAILLKGHFGMSSMPALPNPRHEAFARAIFAGIFNSTLYPTHGHAYNAAGYKAIGAGQPGGAAEAAASRLLKKVKILDRVCELQAQAAERAQESADKCVEELNQIKREAQADRAYSAAVAAVLGKVKILGLAKDDQQLTTNGQSFSSCTSMQDIGKRLLEQVGLASPDDVSIQEAIEANNTFIARLEQIRDRAQTLSIE